MQDIIHHIYSKLHMIGFLDSRLNGLNSEEQRLLEKAVEHVVENISIRFRGIYGYQKKLKGPVANTLHKIDSMVEAVPRAFLCSKSTYVDDARVNAFFASSDHLREVVSDSKEVRQLFDNYPATDQCWGLLCMHRSEDERFGMEMVGEMMVREVRQNVVNFTDHQILSPGVGEDDARKALKCCIFNNLLDHCKQQLNAPDYDSGFASAKSVDADSGYLFVNLTEQFDRLVELLSMPEAFVQMDNIDMNIDRMKVRRDGGDRGFRVEMTEINIASKGTRIGAMVAFNRDDLLPEKDFYKNIDSFLAM